MNFCSARVPLSASYVMRIINSVAQYRKSEGGFVLETLPSCTVQTDIGNENTLVYYIVVYYITSV